MEKYLTIKGYEGLYSVSNNGNIYSIKRNKKLSPSKSGRYLSVWLWKNKERKCFNIHRLVASAFIFNPNSFPVVNHIDENTHNNCVENLEWCTQKKNANHGTRKQKYHKAIIQSKNDTFIKEWNSIKEASESLGLHTSGIGQCLKGSYKQCGGYQWKYA